ncbi:MAG: VPLPA-CTERM sorting domain-containing protein [Desulfobacterium sp.]|nr:VPLPA-CTERM sorting domain-containing protein [Desulfobacterium sp.]
MKKVLLVLLLAVILPIGQAGAAYWVIPTVNWDNWSSQVHFSDDADGKWHEAGLIDLTFYESQSDYDNGKQRLFSSSGFCIELGQWATLGEANTKSLTSYSSSSYGQTELYNAAWLINEFWSDTNNNYQNGALQIAIWDTLYSGKTVSEIMDYGSPGTSHTEGYYNNYINALNNSNYQGSGLEIVEFTNPNLQNIIKPVPLPATFLLMGLGLAGLTTARRKKIFNT